MASKVFLSALLLLAGTSGLLAAADARPSLLSDVALEQLRNRDEQSRRRSVVDISSSSTTAQVLAKCDCGFNDLTEGADPTQVWTSLWKADFTTMRPQDLSNGFRFMRNEISRQKSEMSRAFNPSNAALCDDGLCLTVQPVGQDNKVPCAGVYTKETDMHFGNYYAEVQIPSTQGTVSAFYVYKTDENEVDMEFNNLAGAPNDSIKDTVKPQIYNGSQPDPRTYQKTAFPPGVDMSQDFHTWGFHWRSSSVTYGLDGVFTDVITVNVPQLPGVVSFSHWSDGNPSYSGGPPTQPTVLKYRRAWAFWNDTTASMPCKITKAACSLDARVPPGSSPAAISSARARVMKAATHHPVLLGLLLPAVLLSIS
ncbi:hypothetical protein OC845_000507 [Tilletia horrida]|nr:hypothetical protein OC845_000507 [Tilletia horrida]